MYKLNIIIKLDIASHSIKLIRALTIHVCEKYDTVKVNVISDNELNMTNSKIMGNEIKIKSPTIENDENSSFIALKNANIETEDFKKLNIDSPSIIFNDKDISECGKTIELEKVDNPLKNKRLELLEVLKKIRDKCTEANDEMVKDYKNSLNDQPISKILKNTD